MRRLSELLGLPLPCRAQARYTISHTDSLHGSILHLLIQQAMYSKRIVSKPRKERKNSLGMGRNYPQGVGPYYCISLPQTAIQKEQTDYQKEPTTHQKEWSEFAQTENEEETDEKERGINFSFN